MNYKTCIKKIIENARKTNSMIKLSTLNKEFIFSPLSLTVHSKNLVYNKGFRTEIFDYEKITEFKLLEKQSSEQIHSARNQGYITVGIDVDGTCLNSHYPLGGDPFPWVKEKLTEMKEKGWIIMLMTARVNEQWGNSLEKAASIVTDLFKKYELSFDEIWMGKGKPYCRYYLGDETIPPFRPEYWQYLQITTDRIWLDLSFLTFMGGNLDG